MTYNRDDIIRSFRWLGHQEFTELAAFHPDYKPGQFEHNREHGYMPKIWYIQSEKQLMGFVHRFNNNHTLCYGINPRPRILKQKYVKSAKDSDIQTVMNMYLDFDIVGQESYRVDELLSEIEFYLGKENIRKPVRAFTGNGYHLLFALPRTSTEENPDISERLKKFRDTIHYEFSDDLVGEGIKLDNTMDLRRMAKIYGTRKPYPGARLSRFPECERIEDYVLKEYLLALDLDETFDLVPLKVSDNLPETFEALLLGDSRLQKLWFNEGKTGAGDFSRTGYDFSIVRECIRAGITDINDLFAILKIRPEGAYQKSGKNEKYIRRTIGTALYK